MIDRFLEPAGADFVEELVFRFLLTRGDTLGGSMRNIGGFLAQCKLTRSMIAALNLRGTPYRWQSSDSKKAWIEKTENDADIELRLRGLAWNNGNDTRTLIYNLTVPLVQNNVDLCLFRVPPEKLSKGTLHLPTAYVAMGELKGGIDPAGADEHWKTARTAIDRIQSAFVGESTVPHVFFIGAAIETRMAGEIWGMLEAGRLTNAANLTNDDQIASITRWLCAL